MVVVQLGVVWFVLTSSDIDSGVVSTRPRQVCSDISLATTCGWSGGRLVCLDLVREIGFSVVRHRVALVVIILRVARVVVMFRDARVVVVLRHRLSCRARGSCSS